MRSTRHPIANALDREGGLLNAADIARRYNTSRERAGQLTRHPDFPQPVARAGKSDLWLASEVDRFRATPRQPGRPAKT